MSTYKVTTEFPQTNTDSSIGIYCVSTSDDTVPPGIVDPIVLTELPSKDISKHRRSSRTRPLSKHTNLDVKPLSLSEKLTLYRLYYCQLPTLIHHLSVLACIVWSGFSLHHITAIYFEHNTNAKMEYSSPDWTYPPAVTFCLPGLIFTYSFINPNDTSPGDLLESNRIVASLPNGTRREGSNIPEVDIDLQCTFTDNTMVANPIERNCTDFTKVVVSLVNGIKCFTYFSDIYGKPTEEEAKKMKMPFDTVPTLTFRIGGQVLNGFVKFTVDFSMVQYLVHDREAFPRANDIRSWPISPGNHLEYQFTTETWDLKPRMRPRCFEYRSHQADGPLPEEVDSTAFEGSDTLVSADGRALYRSAGECFLYCLWRRMYANRTIDMSSSITSELLQRAENFYRQRQRSTDQPNLNVHGDGRIKYRRVLQNTDWEKYARFISDSYEDCSKLCVQACQMVNFFRGNDLESGESNERNETVAYLSVRWSSRKISSVSFTDTLDLLDATGYIGGLIHIWLSLSVLGVIRYLIRMAPFRASSPLYNTYPFIWFIRWRAAQKKATNNK